MKLTLKSIAISLSVVASTVLLLSVSTAAYVQGASQVEKPTSQIIVREAEEKAVRESIEKATIGVGKASIKVVGKVAESAAVILQVVWPSDMQWDVRGMPYICIDDSADKWPNCDGFKKFTAPASYKINWVVNDPETWSAYSAFWKLFNKSPVGLSWLNERIKGDVYCATSDDFHNHIGSGLFKSGTKSFDDVGQGTYKFSVTCDVPAEERWYVKAINWLMDFAGTTPTRGPVTHSAYVATQVNSAPTPVTSLSVSLNADQSTLSGSGRVMLTARTKQQNIPGNINYTFYCNRSDIGVNITSGYIAKFDNRSELTQSASCFYGQAGVYTAKVIVNSGNRTAQDQTTITVVNQKPTGYHDSADNNTCHTTGWAYDPDDSSKSINVHVYRDGLAGGGGIILDSFPANVFRDDANKQEKISGNHGFDANLAPYISDGKSHSLYVYPIDTKTGLGSPSNPLNRTPKTIQCSAPAPIPGKTPPSVDIKAQ